MRIFSKLIGDANQRYLKKFEPIVRKINSLEEELKRLSDKKLQEKSLGLKEKISKKKMSLEEALPYAFALVREAARRTLGQRHFDEQLMGGIALHRGEVIEMKTGEGKTLCATLPVYLNALEGKGVHLVTVNDYLARRDTVWMGQIYHFLGLSVGCIQQQGESFIYDPEWKGEEEEEELDKERDRLGSFKIVHEFLKPCKRKQAYQADITYGTNNEFGFDYLRDNMVYDLADKVQRGHYYVIIDEVDSILIDEARTPLIISRPDVRSGEFYKKFAQIIPHLKKNQHYNVDEKMRAVTLTDEGINKVEELLGIKDIYASGDVELLHHLEQALRAEVLYKKDRDYVVRNGEIIIVDEFTGRLMPGRRYSEGLHQAIEAKEGVEVKHESRTLATITFQNYFRLYQKLAGMTGTAATSAEEFHKVYNLGVVIIPTHKPMIRKDLPDRIYQTERGKFKALVREIKERHKKGQPLLVGTISIEKNEYLSTLLKREGIAHNLLNAKHHEKEAQIIAQAGKLGAVTVATNMAGRGVDIVLGGNPPDPKEAEKVKQLGGLHVIGTERHEARRIDNQLRGRAGRQGDPGSSQFFVSLEDDLMRIFASEKVKNLMGRFGVPEDQPIENKMISRAIEAAQAKIEGLHFDIRKHVLEYDDVMNVHRETIYRKRNEILKAKNPEETFFEYITQETLALVKTFLSGKDPALWDIKGIREEAKNTFGLKKDILKPLSALEKKFLPPLEKQQQVRELLEKEAKKAVEEKLKFLEQKLGRENLRQFCKALLLGTIDMFWMEHLDGMSYLRESVRLRAYGQKDPLVEYKNESYRLFNELLGNIRRETLKRISYLELRQEEIFPSFRELPQKDLVLRGAPKVANGRVAPFEIPQGEKQVVSKPPRKASGQPFKNSSLPVQLVQEIPPAFREAGRNDPCPCGSSKKYKKCCWDKYH